MAMVIIVEIRASLSLSGLENHQCESAKSANTPLKFQEQLAQAENFLKILRRKVSVRSEFTDLCGAKFHVGTELAREGENVSGTISFQVGTQRCPGRLSAR